MGGTLLAYDAAFPRARVASGPIYNTPSADELRRNNYPEPYRLLAIAEASTPVSYYAALADAARAMRPIDRLIIFGHGRVVDALRPDGRTRVTTGIIIGSSDITAMNASSLDALRGQSARGAQAELWVCEGSARRQRRARRAGNRGHCSARRLPTPSACRSSRGRSPRSMPPSIRWSAQAGGWQSTAHLLPWEGATVRFTPRP